MRARTVAMVGIFSVVACSDGRDAPKPPVEHFRVSGNVEPTWPADDDVVDVIEPAGDTEPERLRIYLDLSSPMAGFIPLGAATTDNPAADESELRTVAQWIPDHLGRVYAGTPLQWRGVAQGIEELPQYPRLTRDLFTGTASQIGVAIREILADFQAGRAEGAAIITDLVGTGEQTGALAVARYLTDWLASAPVRSGEFHLGLIGIKATYWGGVHRTLCPPLDGLGCWFSERMPGWKRLEARAVVPFYVLLLGRGADALNGIAQAIQRDANSRGIEAVWELMTAATVPGTAEASCSAFSGDQPEERQYDLWRDEAGSYGCYGGRMVGLSCTFDGGVHPTAVELGRPAGGTTGPFTPDARGGRLEVTVDCGMVGNSGTQDLLLDVMGDYTPPGEIPPWDEWSIETDDLPEHPGKTLQLRYFVEETRVVPESYRIVLPPLLRAK